MIQNAASLATDTTPIAPPEARFIRFGPGGRWARHCFETGTMRFGVPDEPHDLCLAGDWDGAHDRLIASGKTRRDTGQLMREIHEFYTLDPACLWITLAEKRLWWGFAEPELIDLRQTADEVGIVARNMRGGWRCDSITGETLLTSRLASRITQVGAYQRTLCRVREIDAVCRVINGLDDPAVDQALKAQNTLVDAIAALIKGLHQSDFEILADLTLAGLGWRRQSRLGGSLADADLFVEQPATGERALVQVKSRVTQAVLDDYIARADHNGCQRVFFLCHSPDGGLDAGDAKSVHVWTGRGLAEKVVALA